MKYIVLISLLILTCTGIGQDSLLQTTITRLNGGNPVIDANWFGQFGITNSERNNINGPCLIKLPSWLNAADRIDPSAQYYLYFGHHSGNYIRMAWSTNIEGPYTMFNAGSNNDPSFPGRGVFDLGSSDEVKWPGGGTRLYGHCASPQVLIDDVNEQFILFLHGNANGTYDNIFSTNNQKTFVATSSDGLNFNCPDTSSVIGGVGGGQNGHGLHNQILTNAYLKTFVYEGEMYGFTNYGVIWKSPKLNQPWYSEVAPRDWSWEEGLTSTNPVYEDMKVIKTTDPTRNQISTPRHFATRLRDDGFTLEVWYTCRGEAPERVYRTTIDLRQDWLHWDSDENHQEMIRPEEVWEGANLPVTVSQNGSQTNVNQIRDPELFQDSNGIWYLLYCAQGEEGIGIAQITDVWVPDTIQNGNAFHSVVMATATNDDGNVASNVLDGNFQSRWSSNVAGVELVLDMGQVNTLTEAHIAFFAGDQRQSYFELLYSTDGVNYQSLGSFTSSGTSLNLEIFDVSDVNARYVKYIGNGNSSNGWNSSTEMKLK